jgi:hypothetical protein
MRLLGLLVGFAAAALLVTIAVANRHAAQLVLDPFNPKDPVLAVQLPFYAYLFAMLIAGVLLGGLATWLGQGKWRRIARTRTQEAARWKGEAERLTRERDARVTSERRQQLAVVGR